MCVSSVEQTFGDENILVVKILKRNKLAASKQPLGAADTGTGQG